MKLLIPWYIDPLERDPKGGRLLVDVLIDYHRRYPSSEVMVILNPDSGPSEAYRTEYDQLCVRLDSEGITSLGYVAVGYGKRDGQVIAQQISCYSQWYPSIGGIFLDEFPQLISKELCSSYDRLLSGIPAIINPGVPLRIAERIDSCPFSGAIIAEGGSYPELSVISEQKRVLEALSHPMEVGVLVHSLPLSRRRIRELAKVDCGLFYQSPRSLKENPWGGIDSKALRNLFRFIP